MTKEEIIKANNAGYDCRKTKDNQNAEDYFNETFNV